MNRVLGAAVAAATLAALLASPAHAYDAEAAAPGVEIPVRLTERISSQDAQSGQRFGVETTRDVKVGDIVVPLGTKGHGVVEISQSARGQKPGKLVLSMRSLDLPGGGTISVSFAPTNPPKSNDAKGPPLSLGNGAVAIGGYASAGTNVVYEKGTTFTVTTLVPNTFLPAPEPS